jgi:hypothetical protein
LGGFGGVPENKNGGIEKRLDEENLNLVCRVILGWVEVERGESCLIEIMF